MQLAAFTLESLRRDLTNPLILFGFAGQFIFFLRFFVQWVASERSGRSHVPIGFWYLSIAGGLMLMIYAILRADIVITVGQGLGLVIYIRNLMLIYSRRTRAAKLLDTRTAIGQADEAAA